MNSIFKITILIISFVAGIQASLNPAHQIKEIKRRSLHILDGHCSHPKKEQLRLVNALKEVSGFKGCNKEHMSLVIHALAYKNTLPHLNLNESILTQSLDYFYDKPGYLSVLIKTLVTGALHHDNQFKGYLYEIETAVEIENTEKEIVQEFCKIVQVDKQKREIDLVTDKAWIECKAIHNTPTKNLNSLKKQVLAQKALLDAYNETHETNLNYWVSFKENISDSLKQWLEKNNISFAVGCVDLIQ